MGSERYIEREPPIGNIHIYVCMDACNELSDVSIFMYTLLET